MSKWPSLTVEAVTARCQSGSCPPLKWLSLAVEVAITHPRGIGHHPSLQLPLLAVANRRSCFRPPLAVAIATAAFACHCMHSQLPLPAITAAVASCRLLLGCLFLFSGILFLDPQNPFLSGFPRISFFPVFFFLEEFLDRNVVLEGS